VIRTNLEYTSTLSINSRKHGWDDAFGLYYADTGYGICFLDRIRIHLEKSILPAWEQDREWHRIQIEWGEIEDTEETEETEEQERIECFVIDEITRIDFHEFVHHFLNKNEIVNDCCDHHENEIETSDSGNLTNPDCWLCNFTREPF
jgi:hypothetical protein